MISAKEILDLNDLWINANGNAIADNVEEILIKKGMTISYKRLEELAKITNSSKHATYAWFNRGRENVKIPFLKLCMIANTLNVDINELLKEENTMYERKFAIIRVVGNNETVLKYFEENEKEEAKAYGAEIAKTNTEGVIVCELARFDNDGNKKNNESRVFEVWNNDKKKK